MASATGETTLSAVKLETESAASSPAAHLDDDIYEDPGDLDFTEAQSQLFLARLPRYLWQSWAALEEDENGDVNLGTIRIEGDVKAPQRMSLMLSAEHPDHKILPREYNLQITNSDSSNTFVFTEKDLNGFNRRSQASFRPGQDPASLPFSQAAPRMPNREKSRPNAARVDKTKRFQPYFRRAIPKRTGVAGQVRTEVSCLPVENSAYHEAMQERARHEAKPARGTRLLTGPASAHGSTVLQANNVGPGGSFTDFIKPLAPQKSKGIESKAARIPQNELLDLIHDCFKRYKYWPIKALKVETRQPEAYLRATLEMTAQLVRQGPHAMTWQLKPEFQLSAYESALDTQAPDAGPTQEEASDDAEGGSEDSAQMEDVR